LDFDTTRFISGLEVSDMYPYNMALKMTIWHLL